MALPGMLPRSYVRNEKLGIRHESADRTNSGSYELPKAYSSYGGFHEQLSRPSSTRGKRMRKEWISSEALFRRRSKLRELLDSERRAYLRELQLLAPTNKDRKDNMTMRAATLRSNRELERKQIVDQKLRQRIRESDERFREAKQEKTRRDVISERALQMEEQRRKEAEEAEQNRLHLLELERKRLHDLETIRKEKEAAKSKAEEMSSQLQQQMRELATKEHEANRLRQEQTKLEEQMRLIYIESEAREHRENKLKQVRYAKQLQQQHKAHLQQQSQALQKNLEIDLKMLENLAARHAEDTEIAAERKRKAQADVEWMKKEVERQIRVERKRAIEIDEMYREDAARMFTKQEAVWNQEKIARERLLKNVLAERELQIQERLQNLKSKQKQSILERERLLQNLEIQKEQEKVDAQTARIVLKSRRAELDDQLADQEKEKMLQQQEEEMMEKHRRMQAKNREKLVSEEINQLQHQYSHLFNLFIHFFF
eukprot:m.8423 g.8423  ORF g.8423 m.8423 type:complete len:486 (-) comp3888_c0_seq1:12-1469(-)